MTYLQTMQNNKSVTCSCMPNSQQTFVLKTSFVFIFRRRLDQDKYVRLSLTSSRRLQMSWSRPIYSSWPYVFKTSSKHFQDVLPRCLQDIFKTSSRRLAKTSWRYLQDVFNTFWKRLQDIFKTYSRRIIKLKCSW